MSTRSDKAVKAAEEATDRALAALSPDDYEEALGDLIDSLREKRDAAKAARKRSK